MLKFFLKLIEAKNRSQSKKTHNEQYERQEYLNEIPERITNTFNDNKRTIDYMIVYIESKNIKKEEHSI